MHRFMIVVVVAASLATSLAMADVYRYQTPDGRWLLTDRPPPVGVQPVTTLKATVRPAPEPAASEPVPAPVVVLQAPASPEPAAAPSTPEPPASTPVDTAAFALLRQGISMGEVKRRIGPPEERLDHGTQWATVVSGMRAERRTVHKETWLYPGTRYVAPVRLVFHDALLARKVKEVQ